MSHPDNSAKVLPLETRLKALEAEKGDVVKALEGLGNELRVSEHSVRLGHCEGEAGDSFTFSVRSDHTRTVCES